MKATTWMKKALIRMSHGTCPLVGSVLVAATSAHAQDRADIDRTRILGNRELPKVIYIVPWKKPLPVELSGKPVGSALDEALAPVDREVHRRQVAYHAQVTAVGAGGTGTTPASMSTQTPSANRTPTPSPKPQETQP